MNRLKLEGGRLYGITGNFFLLVVRSLPISILNNWIEL